MKWDGVPPPLIQVVSHQTMTCNCSKYSKPIATMQDVLDRCAAYLILQDTLDAVENGNWRSVMQCSVCGALWALEYPFGESHGGGQGCLYQIETDDPSQWLEESQYLSADVRRKHEDTEWYKKLGPEEGPGQCNEPGCSRKRIMRSSKCKQHHFQMIKGRPYEI